MEQQALMSPASISWREVWPGVMTSVIAGCPEDEDSPFVVLYRTSVPLEMGTHSHPREERLTVLDGSLELGFGESSADSEMQSLGPGSYAVIPGGVPHRLRYAAGSLVQIHGRGRFETRRLQR